MKNIKKRFAVAVTGILAAFLLPLEIALAAPGNEMGCILRQPGSMKFVGDNLPDKKAIGEAAVIAHQLHGTKVIDPCLTGQTRNIPASVYARLAEKHPEKFQSLDSKSQSVALSAETVTGGAALGIAPQYRYVGILGAIPPETFFFPIAITNDSRVYGQFFSEFTEEPPFSSFYAAVFEHGAITVLQGSKGFIATRANEGGTVGGFVVTDFENFFGQAALFVGNEMQLIPRLPGDIHSEVILLNDPGVALIFSFDENFNGRLALYKNGKVAPVDFGPDVPFASPSGMNNQGIIVGNTSISGLGIRGFRFDPRTNAAMLLEPLPTEPDSLAEGINSRGDVLGYSFIGGAIERIGVWNAAGKFRTYFVEGTPEFPTVSNALFFNDNNQIVITRVSRPLSERNNSYLVPKPGVRINLADLVTGTPSGLSLFPNSINNQGNMIGNAGPNFSNISDFFLLERTGRGDK